MGIALVGFMIAVGAAVIELIEILLIALVVTVAFAVLLSTQDTKV